MATLVAMNSSPHHPKVKVSIGLPAHTIVAGQEVRGKIVLESRTDKGLGLKTIAVNLRAKQELSSRDHVATSTFLKARRLFQGNGLPISNAVLSSPLPDSPPVPRDYYPARKGQTTFFFAFQLPFSSPASINFGNGVAKVQYEITAYVEVFWKGERKIVTDHGTFEVAECPEDLRDVPPVSMVSDGGKLQIQARVVGGYAVSGSHGCLELLLKNHSSRKTNGVTVALCRKLRLAHPPKQNHPFTISDTLITIPFRGPEYNVPPGVEGVANLVFEVPSETTGVRPGQLRSGEDEGCRLSESLFSVDCELVVTISMGVGAKEITLPIPLLIVHPFAMPEPDPRTHPEPLAAIAVEPFPVSQYPPYPQSHYALEPPRPLFAQQHYSSPPSPQFLPYPSSPVHSAGAIQALSHSQSFPYFPAHSSQPGTPRPLPQTPVLHGSPYTAERDLPSNALANPSAGRLVPSRLAEPRQSGSANITVAPQVHPIRNSEALRSTEPVVPILSRHHSQVTADPAEGKGRRAERISRHLRLSSRNRSVSPASHRFPIPPSPIPQASHPKDTQTVDEIEPLPPMLSVAKQPTGNHLSAPPQPNLEPVAPAAENQIATALVQPAGVISPKPMLSPQLSYNGNQEIGATGMKVASIRSERVETLERLAEQVIKEEEIARSLGEIRPPPPETVLEMDKTLPTPPVPSGKPARTPAYVPITNVGAIFGPGVPHETSGGTSGIPSTGESGLDALERRLASGQRILHQRERSLSREPQSLPKDQPRRGLSGPRNEQAEVALANKGKENSVERGLPPMPMPQPIQQKTVPDTTGAGPPPRRRSKSPGGQALDQHTNDETLQEKEKEMMFLRKEAQSRVALWLGGVQPSQPEPPLAPWTTMSGQMIPIKSSGFMDTKKLNKPAGAIPLMKLFNEPEPTHPDITDNNAPLETSSLWSVAGGTLNQPEMTTAATGSPISQPRQRLEVSAPLRSLQLPVLDGPKYDVRSARGGRGGKVTEVASLWANRTTGVAPASSPPPANKAKPPIVPANLHRATASPPREMRPPSDKGLSPERIVNPRARPPLLPASASLPAINDTLARPVLSSAASLAFPRPTPRLAQVGPKRVTNMPPINESAPKATKDGVGVGQAKLKDLIAKYQQTTQT